MERDDFRSKFTFEAWFDEWLRQLGPAGSALPTGDEHDHHWSGSFEVRRAVLEALSDAGAEQFLNPLVASHLRAFGSKLARTTPPSSWFWVRSEWSKVDISYGLAQTPFAGRSGGWEKQWRAGDTGDLGQCEVKVCYTHQYEGRLPVLQGQLRSRRASDRHLKAPGFDQQRYHGLVWLFQHEGVDELEEAGEQLLKEARDLRLKVLRGFSFPRDADNLGRLWPSCEGRDYKCGMSLALVELKPNQHPA
ncbi:MAG: hypothetical protein IT370_02735 [Deltaproteobacteria bacterium]|nr:hypothetical protein [Deltaproteobacteria bacterium]